MPTYRVRVAVDLVYKADEPLSGVKLARIANRTGTYLRTGAVEGLENKAEVLFDEGYQNQHAHHHDATQSRCRPDYEASADGLGPIE